MRQRVDARPNSPKQNKETNNGDVIPREVGQASLLCNACDITIIMVVVLN